MSRIKKHKLKKNINKPATRKNRLSKNMIWTLILGGLMVASVFGIMFSSYNSGKQALKYNGHKFQRTQKGWVTEINGKNTEFDYHPTEVEELNISRGVTSLLNRSKVVYLTFNPNTKNVQKFELMRLELAQTFSDSLGMYPMPGIAESNEQYSQPIVKCENATAEIPVVYLIEANETKVQLNENCILLEATEYSTSALKDRLIYSLLGIMS